VLIKIWKNLKHHTRFGLITGLAIMIYIGIVHGMNPKNYILAEFGVFPILIVGLAISTLRYLKLNKYDLTFADTFGNGFRTAAMTALLVAALNMLSYTLYPQLKQRKLEELRERMTVRNERNEDIEREIAEKDKNFYSLELNGTIFPIMLCGAISSLVMSLARPRVNTGTLPKN
jgi:hypothetical protein